MRGGNLAAENVAHHLAKVIDTLPKYGSPGTGKDGHAVLYKIGIRNKTSFVAPASE